MNKSALSDERLVSLHRQKRINAFFTLYARYKNYGYVIIQKYTSKNAKYASLLEEKDIILCTAINETINLFDNDKGSFRTLLSKIIEHKTLNLVRDFQRNPLNSCVSIDAEMNESDELNLLDTLTFADQGYSPIERINIYESRKLLNIKFKNKIGMMIQMKEEGYSYNEIAKKFHLTHKATRSIFYRVRKQLTKDEIKSLND